MHVEHEGRQFLVEVEDRRQVEGPRGRQDGRWWIVVRDPKTREVVARHFHRHVISSPVEIPAERREELCQQLHDSDTCPHDHRRLHDMNDVTLDAVACLERAKRNALEKAARVADFDLDAIG